MNIERVMEYNNQYRLVVWRVNDGFYRWRVSHLDCGAYYVVDGSMRGLCFDEALEIGRDELRVWSNGH